MTFASRTAPIRRRHRQWLSFLAGKNAAFQFQGMPASLATRSCQSLAGSSSRVTSGRGAGVGAPDARRRETRCRRHERRLLRTSY